MTMALLLVAVLVLAYANGANDNFKGVATLFGSGTTNYTQALVWAAFTTFLGSLTALFLAETLLRNFSGKGLVPNELVQDSHYAAAVALGAGLTVLLATRIGMPISTTHALIGALVGAGWASGALVSFAKLADSFFAPLLLSPLLALVLVCLVYPAFSYARRRLGVTEQTCFCVGREVVETAPLLGAEVALARVRVLNVELGTEVNCARRYEGSLLGLNAAKLLDRLHFASAGAVGFARGLNDTPKIAALLLLAPALGKVGGLALVGVVIALGGLINARAVAETMSQKITSMNHGQGFTANLLTACIVIGASRFGMPVSTTHVSCGALFGIGIVSRQAHSGMIGKILGAWVTTLPLGAALGAASFYLLP
ncbi:MAG: anion permease [Gemmataceae bacterium]